MHYDQMTKTELIHELQKKDFQIIKRDAEIKALRSRLEIFHSGNFLSKNTRKAIAFLLSERPESRADFDVKALEYDKFLDIYTYYDEFGMKLCLRMTNQKITR